MPRMDTAALEEFFEREFPQAKQHGIIVGEVEGDRVTVRMVADERHLRPGGTVSGPSLFALVDTAGYCLVLSQLGPVALAVTTSIHIDFLRRPSPGEIVAEAELLKLGRRLVVMRVLVRSAPDAAPVAHATLTYSLPERETG